MTLLLNMFWETSLWSSSIINVTCKNELSLDVAEHQVLNESFWKMSCHQYTQGLLFFEESIHPSHWHQTAIIIHNQASTSKTYSMTFKVSLVGLLNFSKPHLVSSHPPHIYFLSGPLSLSFIQVHCQIAPLLYCLVHVAWFPFTHWFPPYVTCTKLHLRNRLTMCFPLRTMLEFHYSESNIIMV